MRLKKKSPKIEKKNVFRRRALLTKQMKRRKISQKVDKLNRNSNVKQINVCMLNLFIINVS